MTEDTTICDPATIAGIALTAGSTVANTAAQSKVQGARDDAMAAERIRQQGLDKEAAALNTQSQDRYKDFEGQQEQKSGQLAEYFTGQDVAEPSAEAAIPTSSSNITVAEEAKQRGQAKEFTDRSGAALADLRSVGDLMGGIGRLQARDATQIGQVGGFKRGSSGVLSCELDDAGRAGDGLKLFGDILGGGSSLLTSAGLSGPTLKPTTYGEFIGAVPERLPTSYFPRAPRGSLMNLYG